MIFYLNLFQSGSQNQIVMMGTKHDTDSDIYGYKKDISHHQEEDTSRQPCQMPENESLLLSQSIPHNPNSSRVSSSPLAEQSPSPSPLPGQNSSLPSLNSLSPLTISSERETSPSTNQEHASSSSSSGGRSPEISDGSVSPENVRLFFVSTVITGLLLYLISIVQFHDPF